MAKTKLFLALCIAGLLLGGYWFSRTTGGAADPERALVDGYLRATYARDLTQAYDFLSSADRQARSRQSFVSSQGAYGGFTLEVARQLAGYVKIWTIERQTNGTRRVIKVGYRVPAPAELNELLLNWDQERLNALAKDQQSAILRELDARQRAGKLLHIEGQETVELVEEVPGWRIFLDWASGTRVQLESKLSDGQKLQVRFAASEVMAKSDELFLVNLTIKNPTAQAVTFSVSHLLDPAAVGEDLQLVECGLLTPTTIEARQEKEFAMAYQLNLAAGQSYRQIKLTYRFTIK